MSGGGNKTVNATSKQYEEIAKQISSGSLNVDPAPSAGQQLAALVPTPGKINLNTPQISTPAYQGNNQQRLANQLSQGGGGDANLLFSQLGQSAQPNTIGGTVNNVDLNVLKAEQAKAAAAAQAAADAAAAAEAAKKKPKKTIAELIAERTMQNAGAYGLNVNGQGYTNANGGNRAGSAGYSSSSGRSTGSQGLG